MDSRSPDTDPVLLVEDNQLNQMVAQGMLRLLGRTSDLAENGLQALDALRDRPYSIVLDATRRIRSEFPVEQQPYIIALTANAMAGDRQRCLDSGMNDYVAKPLSKEALAAALERAYAARS